MMKKKDGFPGKHIDLAIVTGRSVLAGRRAAEADFRWVTREFRGCRRPTVVAINLDGVQVLSSSYFLAGLWPLWRPSAGLGNEIYPLLANASEPILDEIDFVLDHCGGLAWHVQGLSGPVSPTLRGQPDAYDEALFKLTLKRGTLTAKEAHESDPSIGLTAWSSRLSQHHQNRLLARQKHGKEMHYALPWISTDG